MRRVDLESMATTEVVTLDDPTLREQLHDVQSATNQVYAQQLRRVDIFDRRGLSGDDGFRTTKAWLTAFLGMSGPAAGRLVKTARLLRQLPALAAAVHGGQVSAEHVRLVLRLATRVDTSRLVEVDATLAEAAQVLDVTRFELVCQRIAAHLDPDGGDPAADFERRGLTLSPTGSMTALHGQLDPEGAAALTTALDALMTPPSDGDTRTPAQRRADALVELARLHLAAGDLPTVGGQRPQVGVLVFPQTLSPQALAKLAQMQGESFAAARLRQFLHPDGDPDLDRDASEAPDPGPADPVTVFGRTTTAMQTGLTDPPPDQPSPDQSPPTEQLPDEPRLEPLRPAEQPIQQPTESAAQEPAEPAAREPAQPAARHPAGPPAEPPDKQPAESPVQRQVGQPVGRGPAAPRPAAQRPAVLAPAWSRTGWADPPFLDWIGAIPPAVAQRIACDSDIWRVILDPATGMPLDVGRSHRLVPYWMRKALYARDRGCRWPGCHAPAQWTDAHHLDGWYADNGKTKADRCILLCRHHHALVHEGRWRIDLDLTTGDVQVTRPGGQPYQLPRSRSPSWTGPATPIGG